MEVREKDEVNKMDDLISRQAAIDAVNTALFPKINTAKDAEKALRALPSAQPEPDWDYSKETKQITLIVPEDVYDSAETIFLSVGYEGTFGIRGMVYSVQPERKTGKWIVHYECPKCGEITKDFTEYCPFCDADMRGEQDDS